MEGRKDIVSNYSITRNNMTIKGTKDATNYSTGINLTINEPKDIVVKYGSAKKNLKIEGIESIEELKNKIFETIGIHPYFQHLKDDESFVYEYWHLPNPIPNIIFVEDYYTLHFGTEFGFQFNLKIKSSESILDIKRTIEQKYKIPSYKQIWFFENYKLLNSYLTLVDYNKTIDGIINDTFKTNILIKIENYEKMNIFILNDNNKIQLSIDPFNTIYNLYKLLEQKIKKEIKFEEQMLSINNEYLYHMEDMLIKYDFSKAKNILILEKSPFFSYVKTLIGQKLIILCHPSDKISDFKKRILDEAGIPIDQQRLIFEAKQLEDSKTLSDYKIKKGSALALVLRLR